MPWVKREPILTHHRMVASEFDLTLQLVMARSIKTLKIVRVEEQITVAFVWNDMVNHGGW